MTNVEVLHLYSSSIVYVCASNAEGDKAGSAFHIGNGLFVTARHLIEGTSKITIGSAIESNGSPTAALVGRPHFHPDPAIDVAALRITGISPPAIPLTLLYEDWIDNDLVSKKVVALGFPDYPQSANRVKMYALGFFSGRHDLDGVKEPCFTTTTPVHASFAGAPLLYGNVGLGVISSAGLSRRASGGSITVLSPAPIFECVDFHRLREQGVWPP